MTISMRRSTVVPFLLLATLVGCAGNGDGPSKTGKSYLLSAEPSQPLGVVELKTSLTSGLAAEGETATIIGRVGGGQNPTWDTSQASFLLRDLKLEIQSHDHGGDHENCKFCQAEKAKELESMALLQVVDANDKVVSTDARKLLGVKEDDVIVAQGVGEVDEVGNFVFSASKLYIRR